MGIFTENYPFVLLELPEGNGPFKYGFGNQNSGIVFLNFHDNSFMLPSHPLQAPVLDP